eukprot:15473639-Alexandrium_andersonii.AAC.1
MPAPASLSAFVLVSVHFQRQRQCACRSRRGMRECQGVGAPVNAWAGGGASATGSEHRKTQARTSPGQR